MGIFLSLYLVLVWLFIIFVNLFMNKINLVIGIIEEIKIKIIYFYNNMS